MEQAAAQCIKSQISPEKNRKNARNLDKEIYKLRHVVENAFLHLKRWRGIATRYAKRTSSFLAAVHIRCTPCGLQLYDGSILRTGIKRLARKTIYFSRPIDIYEKVIGISFEKFNYMLL